MTYTLPIIKAAIGTDHNAQADHPNDHCTNPKSNPVIPQNVITAYVAMKNVQMSGWGPKRPRTSAPSSWASTSTSSCGVQNVRGQTAHAGSASAKCLAAIPAPVQEPGRYPTP